jgi:hypothetical protein
MTPAELLKTIYLGDRACKGIYIDGWNGSVSLHVDVISRIRSPSGTWDYYADEDIPDGRLVFTGVTGIRFDPSGPVPNDLIHEIRVVDVQDLRSGKELFLFVLSISSVDEAGTPTEVKLEIHAANLHLEDPRRAGEVISSEAEDRTTEDRTKGS